MKKILALAILGIQMAFGQIKAELSSTIPFSADSYAGFDNLGSNYFIRDNTFFKLKEGQLLNYRNISLGRIDRADILNPMNIVLFYKDFNSVVFLDNQLNEIRRVNFSEQLEPMAISAVGNAAQNRLWIYNSINQQIGLFDYLKNSIKYIGQPIKGVMLHYETDFNYFYWMDSQGNRFASDLFGKVSSLGNFPAESKIQFVSPDSALILKDGNLEYFSLTEDSRQLVDLGKKSALGFWYSAQNLTIFTAEGISIYKLKLR